MNYFSKMDEYPIFERIKQRFTDEITMKGLLAELDKSDRWFYKIKSIGDLQFRVLQDISKYMKYDYLADYFKYIGQEAPVITMLKEPKQVYNKPDDEEISITVTVKGDIKKAGTLLASLKAETEKKGFKMD
jgi:hypothetical protein